MPDTFMGFPKGGVEFFQQLGLKQDREWFKAHKADYQRLWEQPLHAFAAALQHKLAAAYPDVAKNPPKLFRLYRDVRFSKDKSPFHTYVSGLLPLFGVANDPQLCLGLYFQLGPECFIAGGRWMMEKEPLARYRAAVADEKKGAAFFKQVQALKKKGYELTTHERLKRVPAPYPQEHPRAELLKAKGFALRFPSPTRAQLQSPKLVDGLATQAKAVKPLFEFVEACC